MTYFTAIEQTPDLIDLDFLATVHLKAAMNRTLRTYKPVLTEQIPFLTLDSLVLLLPGIGPETSENATKSAATVPHDMSMLAVRVTQLLSGIASKIGIAESVSVYLYDTTNPNAEANSLGGAIFHKHSSPIDQDDYHKQIVQITGRRRRRLGGEDVPIESANPAPTGQAERYQESYYPDSEYPDDVLILIEDDDPVSSFAKKTAPVTFHDEISLEEARGSKNSVYQGQLLIASRTWTIVVEAEDGTFKPQLGFVMLGSTMIFVACASLALWMYTNAIREAKIGEMRLAAEADKASIMVENANKAAKVERELNDFIAHEVRNPLSAAISATSFVASSVSETQPLTTAEARKSVREDVSIIGASLMFINDLLRNMLDMHRASSNQLKIEMAHADVLRDILEPVASMLYHRCDDFEVQVKCPKNLLVMTDALRLKQIVLNFGRNAVKFVEKGFVRLCAEVVDGMVHLSVEDSGPGIPLEKRDRLFSRFQESLDSLNQGTGIGLCVCSNLIDLMNGHIVLDETYDSGIERFPGSRFVIQLNKPAVCIDSIDVDTEQDDSPSEAIEGKEGAVSKRRLCADDDLPHDLPDKLSFYSLTMICFSESYSRGLSAS